MKKILSLVLLTALSLPRAEAIFPDDPSLEEVSRFATHYGLNKLDIKNGETFAQQIFTPALKERKYDIPGVYYTATLFFYNKRRVEGEFQLLEDMFKMMPKNYRQEAFDSFNAWAAYDSRYDPMLFQFDGLKERLLALPFDPKIPFDPTLSSQKD